MEGGGSDSEAENGEPGKGSQGTKLGLGVGEPLLCWVASGGPWASVAYSLTPHLLISEE